MKLTTVQVLNFITVAMYLEDEGLYPPDKVISLIGLVTDQYLRTEWEHTHQERA